MIILDTYKKQGNIGGQTYISSNIHINRTYMNTSTNICIWKQYLNTNYDVSNTGLVRNNKTNRILKQNTTTTSNYYYVQIRYKNKTLNRSVHRMVATAFVLNPYNKPEVNHKDGNHFNNEVSNLEWVTRSENNRHSIRVLGNPKPPSQKGNFGKDHNVSIGVLLKMPNGVYRFFGSGLEFTRETGLDHSSLSYARNKKLINGVSEYTFVSGKMKGITIYSKSSPHFERQRK